MPFCQPTWSFPLWLDAIIGQDPTKNMKMVFVGQYNTRRITISHDDHNDYNDGLSSWQLLPGLKVTNKQGIKNKRMRFLLHR